MQQIFDRLDLVEDLGFLVDVNHPLIPVGALPLSGRAGDIGEVDLPYESLLLTHQYPEPGSLFDRSGAHVARKRVERPDLPHPTALLH